MAFILKTTFGVITFGIKSSSYAFLLTDHTAYIRKRNFDLYYYKKYVLYTTNHGGTWK